MRERESAVYEYWNENNKMSKRNVEQRKEEPAEWLDTHRLSSFQLDEPKTNAASAGEHYRSEY